MVQSAITSMRWFRDMGLNAQQEQMFQGAPAIDIDHLFIALLQFPGPWSELARARDLTRVKLRAALRVLTQDDLKALGVSVELPEATQNDSQHSLADLVWTPRARKAVEQAARDEHPEASLLRALLEEPSGRIKTALAALEVDESLVLGVIDSMSEGSRGRRQASQKTHSGSRAQATVSSSVSEVWELVSQIEYWPTWNSMNYENVHIHGSLIEADLRDVRRDGRPTQVPGKLKKTTWTVLAGEEERFVEWEYFHDSRPDRIRRLRIDIGVAEGGSEVSVQLRSLPPKSRLTRFVRCLQYPLRRFAFKQASRDVLDNIRRALATL